MRFKDFGEKICREGRPHCGVVLLRLRDERSLRKIEALDRLLTSFADQLDDRFVVITERQVRFRASEADA